MSGYSAMLRKELLEIRSTSRMWVLPAILVFAGVTGSLLAYLMPAIVQAAGGQPGVTITVADATVLDAYRQFFQQLTQLALIAVIVATAGIVSGEIRSGAAVLVITKPVSRVAFVLAKITSQTLVLVLATLLGTAAFASTTALLFGELALTDLAAGVTLWLIYALLFAVTMVLISTRVGSQAGVAGVGLGLYALVSLLGIWEPLKLHSPSGLMNSAGRLMEGQSLDSAWPLITTLAAIAVVVAAAGWSFSRREI